MHRFRGFHHGRRGGTRRWGPGGGARNHAVHPSSRRSDNRRLLRSGARVMATGNSRLTLMLVTAVSLAVGQATTELREIHVRRAPAFTSSKTGEQLTGQG